MSRGGAFKLKPFALKRSEYFRTLWYMRTRNTKWPYIFVFLLGAYFVVTMGGAWFTLLFGLLCRIRCSPFCSYTGSSV